MPSSDPRIDNPGWAGVRPSPGISPSSGTSPGRKGHSTPDEGVRSWIDHRPLYVRNAVYFAGVHLLPLGGLLTEIPAGAFAAGAGLYLIRIWFITAGYHCYFSHRAFKTSRLFQFVLAVGAQSSGQGSVLRWASAHRYHHAHSDQPSDLHSPNAHGFWYAHFGWLLNTRYIAPSMATAKTPRWSGVPELLWLDRYPYVPALALAALSFALWGLPGLFVVYGGTTVLAFHATFCVNSLAHRFGSRRFDTRDQSRNNWFVALIMLGGGWHNNHHRFPRSARQGMRWWEFDPTYYGLVVLRRFGIVWDICVPPVRPVGTAVRTNVNDDYGAANAGMNPSTVARLTSNESPEAGRVTA